MTFRPFPHKSLVPTVDDGYALGTSSLRWSDGYLGPGSLHFFTTAAETGSQKDWDIGVIEAVGSTRGNLSIKENSTLMAYFDTSGNLNLPRSPSGIVFSSGGTIQGTGTYINMNLPSGGFLFNGGQMSITTSGFTTYTQSTKAWLRQTQTGTTDARLVGSASGTNAGTAARAGSAATDAQGADVITLFEVATDNAAATPTAKFKFTGFQELAVDGYSALPAYSYINDPDTGWYRSAANQMTAATNATPRLLIDSTINASAPLLPFVDDGYAFGSPSLRWKDGYFSHSIGVGTTQPTERIHTDGYVRAEQGIKFTDNSVFYYGTLNAYKSYDESVSSSTTLQDDDQLFVTLAANAIYSISGALFMNLAAASGLKVAFNGTAGFNNFIVQIDIWNDAKTTSSAGRTTSFGTAIAHGGAGSGSHFVEIGGTIETTTAGTLIIQWAQDTSDPGALTMQRGSHMHITRIL